MALMSVNGVPFVPYPIDPALSAVGLGILVSDDHIELQTMNTRSEFAPGCLIPLDSKVVRDIANALYALSSTMASEEDLAGLIMQEAQQL